MTDDDPDVPSEVYAAYGHAMHHAQRLELTLVKLLLMFKVSDGAGETYDDLQRAAIALFKKTMGGLKNELPGTGIDLTPIKTIMEAVLRRRNFLAHEYFRERPLKTQEGYELMLGELAEASIVFQDAENQLDSIIAESFEAQGISVANLLDRRKPMVLTEDGYLVGNGTAAQLQISTERGEETYPTFVISVEWEKATEEERANLLKFADMFL